MCAVSGLAPGWQVLPWPAATVNAKAGTNTSSGADTPSHHGHLGPATTNLDGTLKSVEKI